MRTISATEASRHFSDLLDAVEAGDVVVVTRGGQPVAELRPARRRRGRDLRMALDDASPPDERFVQDVTQTVEALTPGWTDPWADA